MTKSYFYYLRDEKNAPMGTICFIKTDHAYARGVALVNRDKGDFPNKKVGRQIAEGRAIQALCRAESSGLLRSDFQLDGEGREKLYKSQYMPTLLTEVEEKFLRVREDV
jgi:hypothetical protein